MRQMRIVLPLTLGGLLLVSFGTWWSSAWAEGKVGAEDLGGAERYLTH